MSRYYISSGGWEGDYEDWDESWEESPVTNIQVSDNVPIFTGLLDTAGNRIMKGPLPIGFGRDNEW